MCAGQGPPIDITPNSKTAYVLGDRSNIVTPISTATDEPGMDIPVDDGPVFVVIAP
jgi:hypothetical protein